MWQLAFTAVICLWASAEGLLLGGQEKQSIAIIGAGIGGSSAAYFLRQEVGNDTAIEVFEDTRVGGRTQIFRVGDKVIEMGASVIHEQNRHFRELADAMGLKRVAPGGGTRETRFSIYDGQEFVFNQSSWKAVTLYRMLRRYGLSYFWFQQAPKELLLHFNHIYELQTQGRSFSRPEDLLREIGLYNLTQHNMRQELQKLLGDGAAALRFGKEFVGGINHINYNQDNLLNAFAGMVSLLPTVDGRLFALEDGNFQLAVKLLQAAKARLHQPMRIENIEKADGLFYLRSKSAKHGSFSAVVVATPLEQGNLTFTGLPQPHISVRKFQTTVTTIVRGRLSPSFFSVASVPKGEYIMVAEDAALPFSVVAPLTDYVNGTRLYKVFSEEELAEATASSLFQQHSIVASHVWKAYPKFDPPESFSAFELSDGVFYNNALENAASAMELAAIAGKNSALLAKDFLANRCSASQGKGAMDETVEL